MEVRRSSEQCDVWIYGSMPAWRNCSTCSIPWSSRKRLPGLRRLPATPPWARNSRRSHDLLLSPLGPSVDVPAARRAAGTSCKRPILASTARTRWGAFSKGPRSNDSPPPPAPWTAMSSVTPPSSGRSDGARGPANVMRSRSTPPKTERSPTSPPNSVAPRTRPRHIFSRGGGA